MGTEFECALEVVNRGPDRATYKLFAFLRPRAIRYDPGPPWTRTSDAAAGSWLGPGARALDSVKVTVFAPTWLPEQIGIRLIASRAVDPHPAQSELEEITVEREP